MIDDIVANTNVLINKKRSQQDQNFSRDRDCQNTFRTEIMAFLGVLYFIGVKKVDIPVSTCGRLMGRE